LPVHAPFGRNLASKFLPNQPRIDRLSAQRAQLGSNLVEVSEYLKRTLAGIARHVAVVSESWVQTDPCWTHYQQEGDDVLIPNSAVYLASLFFGFRLADVNDRRISLRYFVSRSIQYIRPSQVTFGLLCFTKDVAEVFVRLKRFAGKEIWGALVLQRLQYLIKIHS